MPQIYPGRLICHGSFCSVKYRDANRRFWPASKLHTAATCPAAPARFIFDLGTKIQVCHGIRQLKH